MPSRNGCSVMPKPDELDCLGFTPEEKAELLEMAEEHGWTWVETVRRGGLLMAWATRGLIMKDTDEPPIPPR